MSRQGTRTLGSGHSQLVAALACAAALAGCATAGPTFDRPDPPATERYSAQPLPPQSASAPVMHGTAQEFAVGEAIPLDWWRSLGSPRLDALIAQSLRANPTLEAAQATLRQAVHTYDAQSGATTYPLVNGKVGGQRQQTNTAALGQPGGERLYDLYNASVAVSYNVDIAGGNRRALEALAAQIDHRRYQLEAARLTLAANLATSAIAQAQLAAQVGATESIANAQQAQLEIARQRVDLGAASENDVLALQTQLEQTRATIPVLRNRLEQTSHLIAVLSGQPPGARDVPQFELGEFSLPARLPVSLPSSLVRQRPDIQAAEALLHAASAQVGVAESKMYPQLTLTGNLGSQALSAASLFGAGSLVWGLAAQVAQPLFNPGLPAEKRAAEAAYDTAAANYRETVLQALRNVADVLRAVDNDAQVLAAQSAADATADRGLQLMRRQYALGGASYLQLLTAQAQSQQARVALAAAQAQRLMDTVALYQAMGGGWTAGDPVENHAAAADSTSYR